MLEPVDVLRLSNLCGPLNENIYQLEQALSVSINNRGNHFSVSGDEAAQTKTVEVIKRLYNSTKDEQLTPNAVYLQVHEVVVPNNNKEPVEHSRIAVRTKSGNVYSRGPNQATYLKNMRDSDLTFGVGPAGTGKTYLAVAAAVEALAEGKVTKLVLVRPAVEAGEKLGFLPGDMVQKVDPYLKPVYDALYENMGFEYVNKLIERGEIEIAPLAYMRGRSLNEAFIILDEAQNTTIEQMKMFLTRIGFGSKAVVTGDVTQVDLPKDKQSGLCHAVRILRHVGGVNFSFFDSNDAVRHRLVKEIIQAYEQDRQHDES